MHNNKILTSFLSPLFEVRILILNLSPLFEVDEFDNDRRRLRTNKFLFLFIDEQIIYL